jgi:hypothetical protein
MSVPVVLSYGLGVDSTAILMRWLHEPESRDFDVEDLVVITAMTGDEWPESGELVQNHLLPLLQEHKVRYIQVARASGSQRDGIVILDDSRNPQRLHLEGQYKLSQEMLTAGTVPQMGGVRKCSQKAKGWPLDQVIDQTLGADVAFRHVIGFEANEQRRAIKDARANTAYRTGEYPLIEWGWDRQACEKFILDVTGVNWRKSACVYCPFSLSNKAGRIRVLQQYRQNPHAAATALFMEHVALLFNERQGLNGEVRLIDLIRTDGNVAALAALEERLAATPHHLYRVRRVLRPNATDPTKIANASRAIEIVQRNTDARDVTTWVHRRGTVLPAVEEFFVVAPAVVSAKANPHFETWWAQTLAAQDLANAA